MAFLRNGIQFLYQPYQMGPFVMGYMDVMLPYAEIMDLMDPHSNLYKAIAASRPGA